MVDWNHVAKPLVECPARGEKPEKQRVAALAKQASYCEARKTQKPSKKDEELWLYVSSDQLSSQENDEADSDECSWKQVARFAGIDVEVDCYVGSNVSRNVKIAWIDHVEASADQSGVSLPKVALLLLTLRFRQTLDSNAFDCFP